jgi:hypothetical protein
MNPRGVPVARTFTCSTCQQDLPAGEKGPLPKRCGRCKDRDRERRKASNRAARARARASGPLLALVQAAEGVAEGPSEPSEPAEGPAPDRRLADVAREELEDFPSAHPAAETLAAIVVLVAEVLDSPQVRGRDVRALPGLVKTLLDTLAVLVGDEADEDDDLFGGMSPPMVNATAG